MFRSFLRPSGWLLAAALTVTSGCFTPRSRDKGTPEVKVAVSPRPKPSLSLPRLDTNRVEIALVPAEQSSLTSDADRRFAAAREAFWNRDTEEAVSLLRTSLKATQSARSKRHLQRLIVDCYAEAGQWGEAVARLDEFNLAVRDAEYHRHIRFRAGLPATEFSFGAAPAPLPIDLRLGQLVVANVRINGHEAAAFIDTGFSMSFVTEAFSRRVGLKSFEEKTYLTDANGKRRTGKFGLIDRLELGGLRALHLPVVCGTDRHLSKMLDAVDVVIGWDVLQHADVTWDFPARRMIVTAPAGPIVAEPSLGGRRAPLLRVQSTEGRELDLFLDTGFASRPAGVSLARNAGLLFTKLDGRRVRRDWRPTFTMGMNSFRMRWPGRIRPFEFWMDGWRFELPHATVANRVDVREGFQTCDGIVGNAPFLKGRLRVCGARRLATYAVESDTH